MTSATRPPHRPRRNLKGLRDRLHAAWTWLPSQLAFDYDLSKVDLRLADIEESLEDAHGRPSRSVRPA